MTDPTPITDADLDAMQQRITAANAPDNGHMCSSCSEYQCTCHEQMPRLIAEVRRLSSENQRLSEAFDEVVEHANDQVRVARESRDAAHSTATEKVQALVASLRSEISRVKEQNHMILSNLRWTGDGYEWTGAEFDYRIAPEESVALMAESRESLRRENEQLKATLNRITASHRPGVTT